MESPRNQDAAQRRAEIRFRRKVTGKTVERMEVSVEVRSQRSIRIRGSRPGADPGGPPLLALA